MNQQLPEMLTPHEIADILKISYHNALHFIKFSGIDYVKIGNQYRVSAEKFYAFINAKGKRIV